MNEVLIALIKQGEHQQLDFKHTIDDQKKIARTLVAFANSDGGRLLIGVKDNGKVVGVNPEEEFHMIEGAAKLYCQPEIKFQTKIWQEGFRLVLEVFIEASEKREFKALDEEGKWKAYLRKNDQTLLANKIILKIWSFERKGIQKPLKFGENETHFLSIFKENMRFTLSKIYRTASFQKQQVDQLLALFVYWKILDMELASEGFVYYLKV